MAQVANPDFTLGAQATVYRPAAGGLEQYDGRMPASAHTNLRLNLLLMKTGPM